MVDLRLAAYDDGPVVAGLRRVWLEENRRPPVDDPGFEDRFALWWAAEFPRRVTWLAASGGVAIGMLNVLVFDRMPWPDDGSSTVAPAWGYLANFYVVPQHRNRGVGAALLGACTSYADAHGFARLVLSPSERSVGLYERLGFRAADELMLRPQG